MQLTAENVDRAQKAFSALIRQLPPVDQGVAHYISRYLERLSLILQAMDRQYVMTQGLTYKKFTSDLSVYNALLVPELSLPLLSDFHSAQMGHLKQLVALGTEYNLIPRGAGLLWDNFNNLHRRLTVENIQAYEKNRRIDKRALFALMTMMLGVKLVGVNHLEILFLFLVVYLQLNFTLLSKILLENSGKLKEIRTQIEDLQRTQTHLPGHPVVKTHLAMVQYMLNKPEFQALCVNMGGVIIPPVIAPSPAPSPDLKAAICDILADYCGSFGVSPDKKTYARQLIIRVNQAQSLENLRRVLTEASTWESQYPSTSQVNAFVNLVRTVKPANLTGSRLKTVLDSALHHVDEAELAVLKQSAQMRR